MTVSIYQPRYFPQLHYFNRMISSDVFVFLDQAQYTKDLKEKTNDGIKRVKSFQSDSPVKTQSGIKYLIVPVQHNGLKPLDETEIDNKQNWRKEHLKIIKNSYSSAPFFSDMYLNLKDFLNQDFKSLGDLNIKTIIFAFTQLFEVKPKNFNINQIINQQNIKLKNITSVSSINVPRPVGKQMGSEWTTAICKKIGADKYLCGGTALQGYMDKNYYEKNGVDLVVQNWKCAEYHQQWNSLDFFPNLSVLDLLFNVSAKEARGVVGI